jgi:CelD/BcsL family acetyltransferase involved in cellulose biosynthesis
MDGRMEKRGPAHAAQVDYLRADRYPNLELDWRALELDADGSPFASWPWISTWLATLPEHICPHVVRIHDNHRLLALGLLVHSPRQGLHRLLGGDILHLQQTGDPALDEITVEYGGLLVKCGCETLAYAALFGRLAQADLARNDLHIPASSHGRFVHAALPPRWRMRGNRQRGCYVVDLAAVRTSNQGYLQHLSASSRSGLRQTRRAFEQLGDIRLSFAVDADQALDWLEQLRELHQRRWHDAGQHGAFDSAYFHAFHRKLIRHHHDSGLTRLSRLCCGDVVIGYYYHLLHHNRVYCYNSGLQTGLVPKNDRAGFLLHWLAIETDLAAGSLSYDFLAGDATYKRMLGTHRRPLAWIEAWQSSPRKSALRWLHRQLARQSDAVSKIPALANSDDLQPLR